MIINLTAGYLCDQCHYFNSNTIRYPKNGWEYIYAQNKNGVLDKFGRLLIEFVNVLELNSEQIDIHICILSESSSSIIKEKFEFYMHGGINLDSQLGIIDPAEWWDDFSFSHYLKDFPTKIDFEQFKNELIIKDILE